MAKVKISARKSASSRRIWRKSKNGIEEIEMKIGVAAASSEAEAKTEIGCQR
jgi:hypothetical protein